jgi:hypothetical protein
MTSKKKKKVDFSVRPRANQNALPPTADEWVRDGNEPEKPTKQEERPQKRLTLNLPADLHTDFKGLCVRNGITIQDKVEAMIARELEADRQATADKADPV